MSDNKFMKVVDSAMAPVYAVVLSIWGIFALFGIIFLIPIHWIVIAEAVNENHPNWAGVIIMIFVDIVLTCIACALTGTKKLMPCAWVISIFVSICCIAVMGWLGILFAIIFTILVVPTFYSISKMLDGTMDLEKAQQGGCVFLIVWVTIAVIYGIVALLDMHLGWGLF